MSCCPDIYGYTLHSVRSFANNKMDFATFTSALWVLTKFFVSASSTWQIRGVWLGKV